MKINLSQEDINTGLDRSSMAEGDRVSQNSINASALPDIYQAKYLNTISKKSEGSDKNNNIERPPKQSSLDIERRLRKETRRMPMAFGKVNHRYPSILEQSALIVKKQNHDLEPIKQSKHEQIDNFLQRNYSQAVLNKRVQEYAEYSSQ